MLMSVSLRLLAKSLPLSKPRISASVIDCSIDLAVSFQVFSASFAASKLAWMMESDCSASALSLNAATLSRSASLYAVHWPVASSSASSFCRVASVSESRAALRLAIADADKPISAVCSRILRVSATMASAPERSLSARAWSAFAASSSACRISRCISREISRSRAFSRLADRAD